MEPYSFTPISSPNWEDLDDDEWTRVEGGGLPAPIYVRVKLTRDGRTAIDGLILGAAWPRAEITANTLRVVRPRELLDALFANFDPSRPVRAADLDEWEESVTWGLVQEVFMMRTPPIQADSAGARGAVTTDRLHQFADVYLRELRVNPRKAMTTTAATMNISRATANRWADRARAQGLLPEKRGGRTESSPAD